MALKFRDHFSTKKNSGSLGSKISDRRGSSHVYCRIEEGDESSHRPTPGSTGSVNDRMIADNTTSSTVINAMHSADGSEGAGLTGRTEDILEEPDEVAGNSAFKIYLGPLLKYIASPHLLEVALGGCPRLQLMAFMGIHLCTITVPSNI